MHYTFKSTHSSPPLFPFPFICALKHARNSDDVFEMCEYDVRFQQKATVVFTVYRCLFFTTNAAVAVEQDVHRSIIKRHICFTYWGSSILMLDIQGSRMNPNLVRSDFIHKKIFTQQFYSSVFCSSTKDNVVVMLLMFFH